MAAYDANMKDDPRDYKGPAPTLNRFAQASSSAAAASATAAATATATAASSVRPWRETASINANKRRLSATRSASAAAASAAADEDDETVQPSQKKIKAEPKMAEPEVKPESKAAYALGITGIRQSIIRQALLDRGGECVLVTGDGQRCDRATQYVRDKGVEGKERSIDCLPYCRDRCKEWSRGVLNHPPTAVIALVDGRPIGRFPIGSEDGILLIQFSAVGSRPMVRNGTAWTKDSGSVYKIDDAINVFCDQFKTVPSIIPIAILRPVAFIPFRGRSSGVPLIPSLADWQKLRQAGRLAFRFEGTVHPDGAWIGPANRWNIDVVKFEHQDSILFWTTFPAHADSEAKVRKGIGGIA